MAGNDAAAVIREMYAAVNAGDIERMVDLVTDDFQCHTPVAELGTGKAGMRQLMTIYFGAFSPQRVDVRDVVADGDRVAVLHTHHLTHSGEFAGLPPTGRQVVVEGLEMFRVRDGKIADMWHHDDFLSLMRQLGVIPVPA